MMRTRRRRPSNHKNNHNNSNYCKSRRLSLLLTPLGIIYVWLHIQTCLKLHQIEIPLHKSAAASFSSSFLCFPSSSSSSSFPTSPQEPDWVIFYHIFIPYASAAEHGNSNNDGNNTTPYYDEPIENAKRIVREQIDMIRRSFAGGYVVDDDDHKHNHTQKHKHNSSNCNHTTQQKHHHHHHQQRHQHQHYQPVKVYYITIGNDQVVTPLWMQELCTQQPPQSPEQSDDNVKILPVLDCQPLAHYHEAFEEVTLQALYDHCRSTANENDDNHQDTRVVYLHSKGSYHNHGDGHNDHWRRHGTLAATRRECIHPPPINNDSSNTCNLCGLQFWTYWVHFMPGNFWTAPCSYINKLLPPRDFESRIHHVAGEAMLWTLQEKFSKDMLFPGLADHYGMDRFSSEHWVGSHPDVIPCDMSPSDKHFWYWLTQDSDSNHTDKAHTFEFGMAPRQTGAPVGHRDDKWQAIQQNETLRKKEFFMLPGRLFKWMRLYQAIPRNDSWIWNWYPDGEYWKDAMAKYGNETLEILLGGGDSGNNGEKTFSETRTETTTTDHVGTVLDPAKSPKWAIFHHIVLPTPQQQHQESQPSNNSNWTRAIANQLDWISESYAATSNPDTRVTVFYDAIPRNHCVGCTTSQDARATIQNLCRDNIHCQPIFQPQEQPQQRYTDNSDDHALDTLQSLMDFCQSHASWRVVYLHSEHVNDEHQIQAATSALCLDPHSNDDAKNSSGECNLCGWEFTTQPANAMRGNVFAAKCEYINKLLPPHTFDARMQEAATQALLLRAQEQFRVTLFPEVGVEHFGIGPFAAQHWVGSHPQVQPCQVRAAKNGTSDYSWSMTSRNQTSAGIEDRLERAREYFYLAGRLFKWLALYNETPSKASWVWDYFPDGTEWKEAVGKFGHDVVQQVLRDPSILYT